MRFRKYALIIAAFLLATSFVFQVKVNAYTNVIGTMWFPFDENQNWCVLSGYNHSDHINDTKYALDLIYNNDSNITAGKNVYAVMDGELGNYYTNSYGGYGVKLYSPNYAGVVNRVDYEHITNVRSAGSIKRGDLIGQISSGTTGGNHLHIVAKEYGVEVPFNYGYWKGLFPGSTVSNAYYGNCFTSNTPYYNNVNSTLITSGANSGKILQTYIDQTYHVNSRFYNPSTGTLNTSPSWTQDSRTALSDVNTFEYNGSVYQYLMGTDSYVWMRSSSNGGVSWGSWSQENQQIFSNITKADFDGKIFLSMRGPSNNVYTKIIDTTNGTSNTWTTESVGTISDVDMVVYGSTLYQYIRGGDNNLYYRSRTAGTGWGTLYQDSGMLISRVSSVVASGKIYQAKLGTDNKLYARFYTGSGWTNWTDTSYSGKGNPYIDVYGDNIVFSIRGKYDDSYVGFYSMTNATWTWNHDYPDTYSSIRLFTANSRLFIILDAKDGNPYYKYNDGASWSGWH